jgi:hypothetical protein
MPTALERYHEIWEQIWTLIEELGALEESALVHESQVVLERTQKDNIRLRERLSVAEASLRRARRQVEHYRKIEETARLEGRIDAHSP